MSGPNRFWSVGKEQISQDGGGQALPLLTPSLSLAPHFVNNDYVTEIIYKASLVAQLVKNQPAMRETWVQSLGWEGPWRRERLFTPAYSPWGCKELDSTEHVCHEVLAWPWATCVL